MDLFAIATVVVELLCVHPVLELTDGVMDNKARFDFAKTVAGHRALLVTSFRTACISFFRHVTVYPEVIDGQTNLELDPRISSCTVVLLS